MDNLWLVDGSSLIIKRWRVSFDLVREYFQLRQLWVFFPGMPLQLWNARALEYIGNEFGRFITVGFEIP